METPDAPSADGTLTVDAFVRRLISRGRDLHWLVGAGVSRSAGVPTAADLIYDFKRTLYAQSKRIPISSLDATDPDVRLRLDSFFAADTALVPPGHPEEYAVLFEAVHPDAASRQRKIEQVLHDANPKPALGHLVLAAMWHLGLAHVVWTTNFDDVLEQAANEVAGKPRWLTVASLDNPTLAHSAFTDTARPLLVKLHGDFQSERLNNTTTELRATDNALRRTLTEAMRTRGLVIVGYSGRDDSVMDCLADALTADHPYDAGLYWVTSSSTTMLPRVHDLLDRARAAGVTTHVVEAPSFEELMQSVRLLLPTEERLDGLFRRFQPASRVSPFARPARGGRWPKIRLNAIAVAEHPRTARLVRCDIGGTAAVVHAIEQAQVNVIAARRQDGVLAYGRDADLLVAFGDNHPSLDYAPVDPFRVKSQESADLGLLYDALTRALERERPLLRTQRRRRLLVVDRERQTSPAFAPLRRVLRDALAGDIPGGGRWAEGVEVRLEHRYQTLWLIYTPMVWHEPADDDTESFRRREWTRERQARRYNRTYTALLKAWADILCAQSKEAKVRALGIDDGTDATFTLKRLAPFVERGAA